MSQIHKNIHIANIPFPVIDYQGSIRLFQEWITTRKPHQVCIVNVHTLITSMRDPQLRNIMHNSGLNTLDGQPLLWYANTVCGANVRERVCGPELMLRCIDGGVDADWKHYLLGGRPEVLKKLEKRLHKKYHGINIVGAYSPPFGPLSENEEAEIIAKINQTGADVLWVGLGAPRQEKWIATNLYRLEVPVCVGVGAAFDFHAGSVSRAPKWIQEMGFEWLYRACSDPRLFKRYVDTNPPFLWMLFRDWVRVKLFKKDGICCD